MAVFGKNFLDTDGLNALWAKIKGTFVPQTRTVNGQALSADVTISIPGATTTTPKMNGTAAVGSETKWAKGDHVHPTDTSRAPTSHASNATTYGAGTTANYGHNKLVSGDVNGQTYANGVAAAAAHTHSNYSVTGHTHSASEITAGTFAAARIPAHATNATTYGAGTTTNYGHVKLVSGNVNGQTYANGVAAAAAHTHSNYASSSHTHGNITNAGALQTDDITVASGDKLVVTDATNSNKVARASVMFDGTTTDKALTPKGTFETFLTTHQDISQKANLASPTFTGTPKAPTPAAGTDTDQIATTKFVNKAVADGLSTADAMIYKGVLAAGSSGAYGALTPSANKGWTYKVTAAGKIDGIPLEVGDMLICNTDSTPAATTANYTATSAKWDFVQTNLDGVVTGPAASTSGNFALFDGANGKKIMNSTYSPASFAAAGHTHGNVLNNGTMTATATICNGDSLVIADSDGSNKLVRTSITFDGSTTTQALTRKGTWAAFNNYTHPAGNAVSVTGKPTGNQAPAFGGTFTVSQVTTDDKSHVSSLTDRTVTIPSAVATTSLAGLMSSGDKSKLDGIATGATKNSAFSTITVGSTNIVADAAADTLTVSAGNYMSITPDATNDKITFAVTGVSPTNHASTSTTYGVGTTANYGHSKLVSGDVNGQTYANGVAAAAAHTHSNYSITGHTHSASEITAGTFAADRIPGLNASKITAGTLGADRIPDLNANKITAGTLNAARIPNLDASKITSGTFAAARIPSHASAATTYGIGTTANYGHVKLYDNITGTNTDGAPSQNVVNAGLSAKVNVANVNLNSQSTTILAQVQAMQAAGIHYKRFYTSTDGGANNIADAPGGAGKGFMVEAYCNRSASNTDWRYVVLGYSQTSKPKIAWITSGTTAITWSDLNTDTHWTTHLYAGTGTSANTSSTNGNTKITVTDNNTVRNSVTIKGQNNVSVSSDTAGVITIDGTHSHSNYALTGHTHSASEITAGTFAADRIPGLNANKITAGTLGVDRIPGLNASKITAGTFDTARIPNLDAGKITSGTFAAARIPAHDTSATTYGVGTTVNYGHNKLVSGDLKNQTYVNGVAAAAAHTHSQYLTTHQSITGKEDKSNKVSAWSTTTTNDHYPSEKLVKGALDGKAPTNHASTSTTYGTGTTANYGHNKIISGDLNGKAYSAGEAAAAAHTHSNYAASNHSHGNITNAGAITTTADMASADGLLFADASDSNKIKKSSNLQAATNAGINSLGVGTSPPLSSDYYVAQYAGGGTSTTTYHRRAMSALYRTVVQLGYNMATPAEEYMTSSIASASPWSGTSSYFADNVQNGTIKAVYNERGTEKSLIFSKSLDGNYGTILRWGYADKYMYMARKEAGNWKSTDWEKINAGYSDNAYFAKHYPYDYGRLKFWGSASYASARPYFCIAQRIRSTTTANWVIGGLFILEKGHNAYVKFKAIVRGQQQTIVESFFDIIETVNISEDAVKQLIKGAYENNTTDKTCALRIYIHGTYTGAGIYEAYTLRRLDYQSDYAGGGYTSNETADGYACIADDFWTLYKDITGTPTTVASMTGTTMVTYYFDNRFVRSNSVSKIVQGSIGNDKDTLYII